MTAEEQQALLKGLYRRLAEAVVAPFVGVSIGDWKPSEGLCHHNVTAYVEEDKDCRAVRGWLVFNYNKDTMGLVPVVRFTAHSLVERKDGSLIDITPSRASQRYPFLRHDGTEDEFLRLVQENNIVNLDLAL